MDQIVGIGHCKFSDNLLSSLEAKNITVLKHAVVDCDDLTTGWLSAHFLGLSGMEALEWDVFTSKSREAGIFFTDEPDSLVWSGNKEAGSVTTSLAYSSIFKIYRTYQPVWWNSILWKRRVSPKVKCFTWLAPNHKILTRDMLQQRGF